MGRLPGIRGAGGVDEDKGLWDWEFGEKVSSDREA